MKHIIARLLQDFESGFMNRRQLIENLAIAASTAAAMAGTVEAQATGAAAIPKGPAFRTVELDHISYQVNDYRVTRDFYADLMGMEVKNDNGRNQCELWFGNNMLLPRNKFQQGGGRAGGAQQAPQAAPGAAPQGGSGRGQRPPVTSLVDHISYRIYSWDTDQVKEELMKRKLLTENSRPDTNGGPNYSSWHVSDPDGFNLQISGWAGPKDSTQKKG
jgi:catechol 2,3-dioxygenase-like lactoylglutathione lyase family enzyme